MTKALTLQFSHTFAGAVWNMVTDENADYLVLEIRNDEAHTVSFAALAMADGRLMWQGLRFDEQWWAKVQGLQNGIILFYIFDGNMEPEIRELYAVDILTKKIIWHKKSRQALMHWKDKVLCTTGDTENRQFFVVNFTSGQETTVDFDFAQQAMAKQSNDIKNKSTVLPLHYPKGNKYFDRFRQFLKEKLKVDAVKACDYLAHKNRIAISYYIYEKDPPESKILANYLLVVDENASILLHEKIQDKITAVGLETFFILHDQLIFVRDKKEINSYGI